MIEAVDVQKNGDNYQLYVIELVSICSQIVHTATHQAMRYQHKLAIRRNTRFNLRLTTQQDRLLRFLANNLLQKSFLSLNKISYTHIFLSSYSYSYTPTYSYRYNLSSFVHHKGVSPLQV